MAKNYVFDIIIVGDAMVGKTGLIHKFIDAPFPTSSEATTGHEVGTKHIKLNGKEIELHIWHEPGLERFQTSIQFLYSRPEGFMLVYDITNEKTFKDIACLFEDIKKCFETNAKGILVGNKCDLADERQVSFFKARELAESLGLKFMEVSAKESINIEEAFHTLVKHILGDTEMTEAQTVNELAIPGESYMICFGGLGLTAKSSTTGHRVDLKEGIETESAKQSSLLRRIIDPILGSFKGKSLVPDEIQSDPYAVDLYQKALADGTEKDRSIRINIVGNFKQGKTSLTRRLLGQKIRGIRSTNDIEIGHYTYRHTSDRRISYQHAAETNSDIVERLISVALNNEPENANTINNPDRQQQKRSDLSWQSGTTSIKLDYKPQATRSSESVDQQIRTSKTETVRNVKLASSSEHSVFSKNQTQDNKERSKQTMLSQEEIGTFANALKKKLPQSQITVPTTFDVWDFGGQYIFYATHSVFHTKRAIYLLVFDLSLDLKSIVVDDEFPAECSPKDMKYFLQFWMQSIHSFVGSADGSQPKVILVGTHKDKVKGNADERKQYIQHYFENVRQLFDGTKILNHIYPEDFAVDNTDPKDASIEALKKTIVRLGEEETHLMEIPAKWIHLEKSLRERKHLKIITLKLVMAIDGENEFPLGDLEEAKLFLRYHHGKGTFVFFDEEPISKYVVLDPQFLVDAFRSIITSERFCANDPEIRPLWKRLLTEAKLDKELIDKQWGSVENKEKLFFQNTDILISFLTRHHIISEAATLDEATNKSSGLGWYVVPSLLRDHSQNKEIQEFLEGKQQTNTRLVLSFDASSIVPTIYHRVVSALIAKWQIVQMGKRNLIFTDLCVVRLDVYHAGIAQIKSSSIELTVVCLCPSYEVDGEQADTFRRFSEAVISHEFGKLRDTQETMKPYTLLYRCNHRNHGTDGGDVTKPVEELDGQKLIPCPDLFSHEFIGNKARSEWFHDYKNLVNVPNKSLNDKLLSRFARCVGGNWQLLGHDLGLTQTQLEHIVADNPHSTSMQIYYMLKKWCIRMSDDATVDGLVRVMQHCSNLTVEWDELRNIVDEMM